MKHLTVIVFIFITCGLFIPSVKPDNHVTGNTEKDVLSRLFDPDVQDVQSFFHESFLKQVPESSVKQILAMYSNALGRLEQVIGTSGSYDLMFRKGKAPCKITLNQQGQIIGLWFGHWTLFDDTPEKLREEFKKLDGKVSVTVTRNNRDTLFSHASDAPLAVGSAFKLYILKALANHVEAKTARWDQIIPLRSDRMSLPSGILQNWPKGSPVTLRTLANLMISLSDNTATDHLLFFLGRKQVESVAPSRVRPFLSTLEMFKLKWGIAPGERKAFAEAGPATRREMLHSIKKCDKSRIQYKPTPILIGEVEWHITTRELCDVMYEMRNDPSLSINPGLVDPSHWNLVGYKGGSEPGVLNYTLVLRKKASSPVYCVSATMNNTQKNVDANAFTERVSRLIGLLHSGLIK